MVDALRLDGFVLCLGMPFLLSDHAGVALELVEATSTPAPATYEAFALLFRGPRDVALGQGIARLSNERLGELALFLVPVGRDKDGTMYEAIVNRLRDERQP